MNECVLGTVKKNETKVQESKRNMAPNALDQTLKDQGGP
jgi:hypothetical protein